MSNSVFIIINEWTPKGTDDDFTEIVDNKFYETESDAWVDLRIIANSFGFDLDIDDTSVDNPETDTLGLERETYYIEELHS